MKNKKYLLFVLFSIFSIQLSSGENYIGNKSPLSHKKFIELPLGAIQAKGWMLDQLLKMKDGMTGNLDKIYPTVMGDRNGWLGGDGDVWERGPYWIDGLLPLAYILNDENLKKKVQPWIEWALNSQKENGYFGPETDRPYEPGLQRDNAHDWWPKMVMLKIMQQYYSATSDKRVIDFLTKYFRYQLSELPKKPLGHWTFWGERRGGDNLLIVYWLYNITGDSFLLELGDLIHKQTFDWTNAFYSYQYLTKQHSLHCVNLAQGFKEPAVHYQRSQDRNDIKSLDVALNQIRNTIGLPTGLWGGDELIRFGNPTKGSELCTAVEMMYSLEEILKITSNTKWADYLEKVAYNALPTQVSDDYSCRQYYQQLNQVSVTRQYREFSTPHEDTDLLYGTLTGYPCCTSNLHQGWPKFIQNLWYATDDQGVAALVYAPSKVTMNVSNSIPVTIEEDTNYPFDENVKFKFLFPKGTKQAFFPFHLRIPTWCSTPIIKLNGKQISNTSIENNILRIYNQWKDGDILSLDFPMNIEISQWYDNSAVVSRGPLIYALKMKETWKKHYFEKEQSVKFGEWYYEVTSDSPWNYALPIKCLDKEQITNLFRFERNLKAKGYPWNIDNAPVKIITKARILPGWELTRGSAGPISYYNQGDNQIGEEHNIELIPYGCTTLRITEFPLRNY